MAVAKQKNGTSIWGELVRFDLYKRNQGRLTRQLSALGMALILVFGTWTLSQGPLAEYQTAIQVGIPLAITLVGFWLIFRVVNYPRFADFLIAVEGEMDKVSWPSKAELVRATAVVIITMLLLGMLLFGYDLLWVYIFQKLGILIETGATTTPSL